MLLQSANAGSNVQSENVYIDIISGDTTITFGADHIQNPDSNITMLAGFGYLAMDGISGSNWTCIQKAANSPYSCLWCRYNAKNSNWNILMHITFQQ